jgi:hypothetical protein
MIESQLHDNLSELSFSLTTFYSFGVPNDIIDLSGVSFFIMILPDCPQAKGNSHSHVCPELLPLSLRDLFLLKSIDHFVLGHIEEDLLTVLVFGLYNEARLRLNNCTTLRVHNWLAVLIGEFLLVRSKFGRHLPLHDLLVHGHYLLMRVILEELVLGTAHLLLRRGDKIRSSTTHKIEERVARGCIVVQTGTGDPRELSKFPLKLVHIFEI